MSSGGTQNDGGLDRDPLTLNRFILAEQKKHQEATGDFSILLSSVQLACKVISAACNKAGIANMYGLAGETNATGDQQKKLDVFSNDVFINSLKFSGKISVLVSEENEQTIVFEESKDSTYCIAFDPLDGSSNIDANVSVGTIFSVFKRKEGDEPGIKDILRPGRELAAAGYALYGAATIMTVTTGSGVHGFTLDPSIGEFILTHKDIKIPEVGKIYSINEGNSKYFDKPTAEYVERCKYPENDGKPKSARYIGSMVADVHRTLLYGGIFMYPSTSKDKRGKLRLLYEAAPMALLVEQAGGKATTGTEDILDIVPETIHERAPVFMGSAADVTEVEELYKKHSS